MIYFRLIPYLDYFKYLLKSRPSNYSTYYAIAKYVEYKNLIQFYLFNFIQSLVRLKGRLRK
jgi:hypothetical protein